jgi:tRNA(Ile)-lysidine synthase TilS/MesJ
LSYSRCYKGSPWETFVGNLIAGNGGDEVWHWNPSILFEADKVWFLKKLELVRRGEFEDKEHQNCTNFLDCGQLRLSLQRLRIRHVLDVMHCEKNICENILKYLLGEKDKPPVRNDMQDKGIRFHLHFHPIGQSGEDLQETGCNKY